MLQSRVIQARSRMSKHYRESPLLLKIWKRPVLTYISDGRNKHPYNKTTNEPHKDHDWHKQHEHCQPILLHIMPIEQSLISMARSFSLSLAYFGNSIPTAMTYMVKMGYIHVWMLDKKCDSTWIAIIQRVNCFVISSLFSQAYGFMPFVTSGPAIIPIITATTIMKGEQRC